MNFGDSAEALVGKLHGQVLRLMALHSGKHFAGVAQAARSLPLAGRTKKRLQRLDAAFTVLRHITQPFADQFLQEVAAELEQLQLTRSTCSTPPSTSAPAVRAEIYLLDEHESLEAEVEDALWRFPAQVNDASADGNSPTRAQSGAETRAAGADKYEAPFTDAEFIDPGDVPVPAGSSEEVTADEEYDTDCATEEVAEQEESEETEEAEGEEKEEEEEEDQQR